MKKRLFFLTLMGAAVMECSARSFADDSDTANIIFIVTIAASVLNIILFFKIWGMTNNVAKIKAMLNNDYKGDTFNAHCRKKILQGHKDEVRDLMIEKFIRDVENSYELVKSNPYVKESLMKESIAEEIDALGKRLKAINEPLPDYIKQMKTYEDFFSIL